MLLYLKICSWNGPFIALVFQVAEEVRVTKGNIISFLICCLLWIYPSLEKQTIRPALNVDSISGFSALFSLYRHPPLHRNNREKGLSSQFFLRGVGRLYTDGYFTFNRSRWLFNEDVTAQDYKFLFFWTSIRTLTTEFNSGKVRRFFFLFDKWNYRGKKKELIILFW